ncbi:hypothetical protein K438DRAFT_1969180 [Mycena galopus ATCC 62051]|nr:hypothetical protein K438DRAFT_1969180 [Mycena galopus ATCC 62051]
MAPHYSQVLVNNAAAVIGPFKLTVDGLESQMAINHVGHFLLTWSTRQASSTRKVTASPRPEAQAAQPPFNATCVCCLFSISHFLSALPPCSRASSFPCRPVPLSFVLPILHLLLFIPIPPSTPPLRHARRLPRPTPRGSPRTAPIPCVICIGHRYFIA